MPDYLFNQAEVKKELKKFFLEEKASIQSFGNTVNQTFEAKVFASVIKWYRLNGWNVSIVNPKKYGRRTFTLKFNTRGAPVNYSYAVCLKNHASCQIRHGLRIHTKAYNIRNKKSANVVCDIVVMKDVDIDHFTTDTALPNDNLIAFGEVKHMSAFAELIASFIGLTYELMPTALKRTRKKGWMRPDKISCFLYVSGVLFTTAKGLLETIEKRKFDVDVYSFDNPMN